MLNCTTIGRTRTSLVATRHRLGAAHKVRNPVGFPGSAAIGGERLLPVECGGGDLGSDHTAKNVLALPGYVRISLDAPVLACANHRPRVEAAAAGVQAQAGGHHRRKALGWLAKPHQP